MNEDTDDEDDDQIDFKTTIILTKRKKNIII